MMTLFKYVYIYNGGNLDLTGLKKKLYFYYISIYNTTKIILNYLSLYGEGNGNPLQYSCLENCIDGGAW